MFTIRADVAAAAVLAAAAAGAVVAHGRGEEALIRSAVYQWDALEPRPTKIGLRRDVVRTPTATLAELESHITTLDAQQFPHPPHQHPNEELIILKEGSVEAWVNGSWVPVQTGGMIFFASNVPHTVRNVGEVPATYYVVNWTPRDLATASSAGAAR